jgi:hypothetical protein
MVAEDGEEIPRKREEDLRHNDHQLGFVEAVEHWGFWKP